MPSWANGLELDTAVTTTPLTCSGTCSARRSSGVSGASFSPSALAASGWAGRSGLIACHLPEIGRHFGNDRLQRHLVAVAPDRQSGRGADLGLGDGERQVAHLGEVVAVIGQDHVALLDADLGGGAARGHVGDERAFRLGRPRLLAMSGVTSWICTPSQPRSTLPCSRSCSITGLARLEGMAKPIPTEPPLGE